MIEVSVGVCAYNEEGNIRQCLESITKQVLQDFNIVEIIVVSSASTDRTDQFVKDYASVDQGVRLVRQESREGKSSAVNMFMREAVGEILILVNADNRLEENTLAYLLSPFLDESIGMTGGHPVPVNSKDTLVGFAVHMLWDMHHRLSLISPKTGELVAFRNLDMQISPGINTDEDWIRMEAEKKGLVTAYVPEALVWNKGPETLPDFWAQRTRVNIGEKYMKRRYQFEVPTWKGEYLIPSFLSFIRDNRRNLGKAIAAMSIEAMSRVFASVYVALDKGDPYIWDIVSSTKKLD
ncbi:MAG TPA: glycosyltransferase [Methanomassiliicoccales archaeon]|nr:glycosyltransferase [Methanomassiliicoccales archaeon]